jgi:hypothetical protein
LTGSTATAAVATLSVAALAQALPLPQQGEFGRSADVQRTHREYRGGLTMREFRDYRGREWRVWEVRPESIQPQTKAEDYLAGCYQGGWLVFETVDGLDKRRLCPPPYGWDRRTDADLEHLMERAEILRPLSRARGCAVPADLPPSVPPDIAASMPRDANGNLDMRYLGVVRSFLYPGGQFWKAYVKAHDDDDVPPVLRFACATHTIDLEEWPPQWVDLSDDQLVALLRVGESLRDRRRDDQPTRRHDDSLSEA